MTRQFPSNTTGGKAQARRDNFASTRHTFSEKWGLGEEERALLELPSPTIDANALLPTINVSPLALFSSPSTSRRQVGGSGVGSAAALCRMRRAAPTKEEEPSPKQRQKDEEDENEEEQRKWRSFDFGDHDGLPSLGLCESCQKAFSNTPKASTNSNNKSKEVLEVKKRRFFFAKKQNNSAPDTLTNSGSSGGSSTREGACCGECREPLSKYLDGVWGAGKRDKAGDTSGITPPSVEVWESEIRTARCGNVSLTHLTHVSELEFPDADPPCHFCCEQASTAIHDESRLQIVSGGLVRSRDGSTRSGSAPYINLPSPNVQNEGAPQAFGSVDLSPSISSMSQNLLSPGSHHYSHPKQCPHQHRLSTATLASSFSRGGSMEETPLVGPPASTLTRRPALVPPKLIPDHHDYDLETEGRAGPNTGRRCSDDSISPRPRRSSIVVIPPMQICPGDLLVYGKVLSQRKSLLGTPIESPIPTLFDSDSTHGRKGKATWSLLKLFERGSRSKGSVGAGNLEEIMGLIQPSEFNDPKLSRFKGMMWSDFVAHVCNQKSKKSGSVVSSESSSGPSTCSSVVELVRPLPASPTPPIVSVANPKPLVRKRMGLMRTMSDRYLEKRMSPSMFRPQGSVLNEQLLEGKETEEAPKPSITNKREAVPPCSLPGLVGPGDVEGEVVDVEAGPEGRHRLRQKEALWDLFQSECSFLYDHLMVLRNVFLEPLKRIQVEGFAMYAEPELLFGNLEELCTVTYAFCKEFIHLLLTLTDLNGQLPTIKVLAKLFESSSKARAMSQAYHRYALNYINALNYLETLRRHVEFLDFEKLCMKDPRCKKLQLTDLLVSPVQHLMKVPLILKDIMSRTDEPQEKELIVQILEIQESSIRELDDKMKWLKNFERLLEIQRNIIWPSILEMEPKTWVPDFLRVPLNRQPCDSIVVSPRRQIIHEGLLQLWDSGKPTECYVILFDDMLLITRRKKGLSKKKSSLTENWQSACGKSSSGSGGEGANHRYIVYRQPISLDRFFIHDISEAESSSNKLDYSFVLVSLNRFQQIIAVHTFQAPADSIKGTWLHKLKLTQDKWKRTLQTTVFRGVRSSTDSGQSNIASSIIGLHHHQGKPFLGRNNACESSS